MNAIAWLSGKKTYIIAGAMLIHALSGWVLGEDPKWNEVLTALGLASLRGGISKVQTEPPTPNSPPKT